MILVVKVGTGVLTNEDATLNEPAIVRLVTALAELIKNEHKVLLVSSGAVGSGISALGMDSYPTDLLTKQACAAIGQTRLMHIYENLFLHFGINVAQLLLTADDLRHRKENVKNTLNWLLNRNDVIPVINENDTVAVEELRFGDNDMLSCLVAETVEAKHLFLMTSVDGLYPDADRCQGIIHEVEDISSVLNYAQASDKGKFSMGGMVTKLQTVQRALNSGINTYIANGAHPERISALLKGAKLGTRFIPSAKKI